jgi:hypothetical protein
MTDNEQRAKKAVLELAKANQLTCSKLCKKLRIHQTTAQKWLGRFCDMGLIAIKSHSPHAEYYKLDAEQFPAHDPFGLRRDLPRSKSLVKKVLRPKVKKPAPASVANKPATPPPSRGVVRLHGSLSLVEYGKPNELRDII